MKVRSPWARLPSSRWRSVGSACFQTRVGLPATSSTTTSNGCPGAVTASTASARLTGPTPGAPSPVGEQPHAGDLPFEAGDPPAVGLGDVEGRELRPAEAHVGDVLVVDLDALLGQAALGGEHVQ